MAGYVRCVDCEYGSRCSLREIAKDLIGCAGHSKEKEFNKSKEKSHNKRNKHGKDIKNQYEC